MPRVLKSRCATFGSPRRPERHAGRSRRTGLRQYINRSLYAAGGDHRHARRSWVSIELPASPRGGRRGQDPKTAFASSAARHRIRTLLGLFDLTVAWLTWYTKSGSRFSRTKLNADPQGSLRSYCLTRVSWSSRSGASGDRSEREDDYHHQHHREATVFVNCRRWRYRGLPEQGGRVSVAVVAAGWQELTTPMCRTRSRPSQTTSAHSAMPFAQVGGGGARDRPSQQQWLSCCAPAQRVCRISVGATTARVIRREFRLESAWYDSVHCLSATASTDWASSHRWVWRPNRQLADA
jgi:hypothetical protein